MVISRFFLIAGAVLAIDQAVKFLLEQSGISSMAILPFISVTPAQNTGIFLGLFQGNNFLFALVNIGVAAVIAAFRNRLNPGTERLAAALVLGGTLGNLADRLFRGSVLDYVSVSSFPTFNIADAALTAGAALIIASYALHKIKK